ncbi:MULTISPECIES: tyrosine-type recombinase/integrase [unclassified Microcoleus]|uniref:tyrosine-type recombinase/integrase n=1 Tax=unclassified Microcoleus TaxID=2642155 RepID=UPI002FD318AC
MKAQNKVQSACDVSVYSDKGSLALRFPKRHSTLWELLDGKSLKGKPKCLGIGKYGYSDTPEDWKRATQLAIAMEADLDHPEWEKLFDPTLAKYGLGGGKYAKLADVLQLPGTVQPEPEMTVGQMWEEYLVWKITTVEPSTFYASYRVYYTNILKGLKWNPKARACDDIGTGVWQLPINCNEVTEKLLAAPFAKKKVAALFQALNEAFLRTQSSGKTKIATNPFHQLWKQVLPDTREKYNPTVTTDGEVIQWWEAVDKNGTIEAENDKRSFTKNERDIILSAFYESPKSNERQIAPLIEFLFLTGCRPGEAFALTWGDIKFSSGVIVFSKSYVGRIKKIQCTKTKEVRMIRLTTKLGQLLTRTKPLDARVNDLVFQQTDGGCYTSYQQSNVWLGFIDKKTSGKVYHYPGVVTRLAEEGKISQYLPPYHTRHTYITLTAWANKSDTSALMLLAHACGNSVDVILRYYLGIDESVELVEV